MLKWLAYGVAEGGKDYQLVPFARVYLDTGFALVVAAGLASVWIVQKTADADRLVSHTFEVRAVARTLFSDLQDAEAGQRGYLLTNDDVYLQPFDHARTSAPATLVHLRELTRDDTEESVRLDRVKPLLDAKVA